MSSTTAEHKELLKPLASFTMQPAKMAHCKSCDCECYKADLQSELCPDCYLEATEQEEHERIERAFVRRF